MSVGVNYVFVLNGACIKYHDTEERALRQARQWKATDLSRRVSVEPHIYDGIRWVRVGEPIKVETPMLVPSLTPRFDWDTAPYGSDVPA